MICKDCIKADVCEVAKEFENNPVEGMSIEGCEYFKDKSKFIELPYVPIPVIHDSTGFNADVYCPNCETNLSGYYTDGTEEPLCVIQCYNCGIICDNTKSVTKEEAEKALRESENK